MHTLYANRCAAGHQLAQLLSGTFNPRQAIVLALARGGVPVGYEICRMYNVALDVFVVRKLGVPQQPELAMGAIASGGFRFLNYAIIEQLHLTHEQVQQEVQQQWKQLQNLEQRYRQSRKQLAMAGKEVVLVDDGLATGASMRVAVSAVKQMGVDRIIIAVPVGSPEACHHLEQEVSKVVCPLQPQDFTAVGSWYKDFSQTGDGEVEALLAESIDFGRHGDSA